VEKKSLTEEKKFINKMEKKFFNNKKDTRMKRYSVLLLLLLLYPGTSSGQDNRREVIIAEKIAFITSALDLSPGEAQNFWPVYNEFSNTRDSIIRKRNKIAGMAAENFSEMSSKELEESGDKLISLDMEESRLKAEYHLKFKSLIGPSRVIRLYYAENRFMAYLLKQLQSSGRDDIR